jgi:YacP-like NYN domain-containing protein
MTKPARSPLEGIDRLIVDGNNLLHAGSRSTTPLPASAVIGRLRAAIPANVGIELVFDGAPEPGLRGERIASGLIVRHAGRRSADQAIVSLVEGAREGSGVAAGADNVLVVTDDRELRHAVQAHGAKTARAAWLLARLARGTLQAPAIGNPRPPKSPDQQPGRSLRDEGLTPWRPGRGATTKHGNPKRGHPPRGGPANPNRRSPG